MEEMLTDGEVKKFIDENTSTLIDILDILSDPRITISKKIGNYDNLELVYGIIKKYEGFRRAGFSEIGDKLINKYKSAIEKYERFKINEEEDFETPLLKERIDSIEV